MCGTKPLTSGRRTTIPDSGLGGDVAEVAPGCRIEFAAEAGPDKRSYRVSFEKIRRKLPALSLAGTRAWERNSFTRLTSRRA